MVKGGGARERRERLAKAPVCWCLMDRLDQAVAAQIEAEEATGTTLDYARKVLLLTGGRREGKYHLCAMIIIRRLLPAPTSCCLKKRRNAERGLLPAHYYPGGSRVQGRRREERDGITHLHSSRKCYSRLVQ